MRLAIFFVGELHDEGFNASALQGAERAAARGIAEIEIVEGVPYDQAAIRARLIDLAEEKDGVVFIGGQGDRTTPEVAAAFPQTRFAIVQGARTGPNLASYVVRQEDSAFLAGCFAALTTRSGTVAHLSGHRVRPGLAGRAAFVAGVRHVAPDMPVLTAFCGAQDDNALARRWAAAEIAAGADVIFTMLNGARQGAIDACRAAPGVRQIGNALDWTTRAPDVFSASAIARIDIGVERAIADMVRGVTPPEIVEFGLADGETISLAMAPETPADVFARVDAIAGQVRAGAIAIPEEYDGPEFEGPSPASEDRSCV